MTLHPQTLAKYASNAVMVSVLAALALALWLGGGRLSPDWMRLLAGGAVIGFGLHLFASCRSDAAQPSPDQSALRQTSYQVGYWAMVASVLAAIIATKLNMIYAGTALPLLALPLIAPSLYMAWMRFRS